MHSSVMDFARTALDAADVRGRRVAEAGGLDANGSVRGLVRDLGPASYTATDMRPGRGVDVVLDAADLPSLGTFGVVISTEMLEHAPDWQAAVRGMVTALEPGGVLLLTTRSGGFAYHGYPDDHWRFSLAAMKGIITGAGLGIVRLEDDPEAPGVFVKAVKPDGWSWPAETGWQDIAVEKP